MCVRSACPRCSARRGIAHRPPAWRFHHRGVSGPTKGFCPMTARARTLPRPPTHQGGTTMGNKIHIAVVATVLTVASIAPAALARPSVDVTYGGKTSAKWPVMVQLSRDSRQVVYAVAAWRADCGGTPVSDAEEFAQIPVSTTGKF